MMKLEVYQKIIARLEQWSITRGAYLCPPGADTYGEGIRKAQEDVMGIIRGTKKEFFDAVPETCRSCPHTDPTLLPGNVDATWVCAHPVTVRRKKKAKEELPMVSMYGTGRPTPWCPFDMAMRGEET